MALLTTRFGPQCHPPRNFTLHSLPPIMKSFKVKIFNLKKIVLIGLMAITVFGLVNVALAAETSTQPSPTDVPAYCLDAEGKPMPGCAGTQVQESSSLLYFFTTIAAAVVTLFSYLIQWGVQIGKEIVNLDIVTAGSQAVLMFANLGFVLAIIVMAFATIFRVQSYAMKQVLWKLIVAALLVNFSLMIAGAFINVANIFTDYFLSQIQGGNLATGLAGVLQPQQLAEVTPNSSIWQKIAGFFDIVYWLKYLVSIFFVLIFTILIIFIFVAIFIMLLIRAVALAILLILMPIVWLAWIFPATAKHWQKWWSEFLRWTFFAPIMLFFIVLVINTGNNLNQLSVKIAGQETEISEAFGQDKMLEPGFFAHVGQILIVGGLLIGGLIAANSLGIMGAKQAYGLTQSAGKMFGGWVGKKGLQYGTGWLRRKGPEEGAKSLAERTQEWAARRKTGVGRYAFGWVARGAAGLSAVGGEDLVTKERGQVKKMTLTEKKANLLTASTPRRIALLEDMADTGDLDQLDIKRYLTTGEKARFARFGHGKRFNGVEKTAGKSVEMMEAALKKDTTALKEATDKFVKSLKMEDLKRGQWNDVYAEKPAFGLDEETAGLLASEISAAFIEHMPGAFAKIIPKIKSKNLDNYKNTVEYQIELFEKAHPEAVYKKKDEEESKSDARRSFGKNMGWLSMGMTSEELAKPEGT